MSEHPRMTAIVVRLDKATPGPWFLNDCEGEVIVLPEADLVRPTRDAEGKVTSWGLPTVYRPERRILEVELDSWDEGEDEQDDQIRANAELIAHAPSDLKALHAAVTGVLGLAGDWESRGEHDMAFSKTVPDEDIAMALLTNGADMVEKARHIRNAINDALEGK